MQACFASKSADSTFNPPFQTAGGQAHLTIPEQIVKEFCAIANEKDMILNPVFAQNGMGLEKLQEVKDQGPNTWTRGQVLWSYNRKTEMLTVLYMQATGELCEVNFWNENLGLAPDAEQAHNKHIALESAKSWFAASVPSPSQSVNDSSSSSVAPPSHMLPYSQSPAPHFPAPAFNPAYVPQGLSSHSYPHSQQQPLSYSSAGQYTPPQASNPYAFHGGSSASVDLSHTSTYGSASSSYAPPSLAGYSQSQSSNPSTFHGRSAVSTQAPIKQLGMKLENLNKAESDFYTEQKWNPAMVLWSYDRQTRVLTFLYQDQNRLLQRKTLANIVELSAGATALQHAQSSFQPHGAAPVPHVSPLGRGRGY